MNWLHRINPYENARRSATFLLLVGLSAAIVGYLQQYTFPDRLNILDNPIADFYANIATELISIGVTVGIIDKANRKESEKERKDELLLQMGSPNNAIAVEAVRVLRC